MTQNILALVLGLIGVCGVISPRVGFVAVAAFGLVVWTLPKLVQ